MIQSLDEIEKWYKTKDPWQYETTKDDLLRKDILLSELPSQIYNHVLDIGCGHGYITRDLPGKKIIGVDISKEAIKQLQEMGLKVVMVSGDNKRAANSIAKEVGINEVHAEITK